MKTVADLKRRIVPGTKLRLVYSKFQWDAVAQPLIEAGTFVREVKLVNTAGFAVQSHKGSQLSYCNWPKAKEFKPESEARFTILDEQGNAHLTYEVA